MTMTNPIIQALQKRILELIPHGLDKVWIKATKDDDFHIANVLGIGVETWNTILPYSTLARKDGSIVYNDLFKKLHINVEYRKLYVQGEGKPYWFRFTSVINIDEPRSTKRRRTSNNERVEINASQDNMAPGSVKSF
jgi:hypothetical protein